MAIPPLIKNYLQSFHQGKLSQVMAVGGGSINEAYRYSVGKEQYFVKYNKEVEGIIEKEVKGLIAIANLQCIATPKIVAFEKLQGYEVLVLPYITEGVPSAQAWEKFGFQLAEMHSKPASLYGWNQDNFIGSLRQINTITKDYIDFFTQQRIQPQLELAKEQAFLSASEINQFENLFKKLNEILPDTKPSLVHGDLWSGNFIMGEGGTPYLIDPAIHYSCRETDLAFTHLFGNFHPQFYEAYNEKLPLPPGFKERISLYNLYPLLAHLNLFGPSYHSAVIKSLKEYV